MHSLERRLITALVSIGVVLTLGTVGYVVIEGWNWWDSLWMLVITLTTVGYGEVHPLSHPGRLYTILVLMVGVAVLTYGVSFMTAFMVEGRLHDYLRRRRMKRSIARMRNHTIICGAGRTGLHVIGELQKTKAQYVVIEADHAIAENLKARDVPVIQGDASHEDALREAGIAQAGGLVTCLTADADNLFVVLTAKGLNPKLRVVARYVDERSAEKLRRAGANAVVSPNAIGGLRMASEALRPAVVSFLDVMLRSSKATLRVEEAGIREGSKLAHKRLIDCRIAEATGLLVLALRNKEGEYAFNPPATTALTPGHTLIVMGEIDGVKKLKALAGETV